MSGNEAFESRDKLSRTPQTRPRIPVYPADYNSLLNDSLTHMPSPLSSTRIEQAAIDRQDARDLATKLFDDNSGKVSFSCPHMLNISIRAHCNIYSIELIISRPDLNLLDFFLANQQANSHM